MERSESTDEFFGDQSSEPFYAVPDSHQQTSNEATDQFGAAASHDYRSRESSIKTLSFLDGYDETKEEKLQDGFCDGYKQAFQDAFRIGQWLGLLSASVALHQSITSCQRTECDQATDEHDLVLKILHHNADLIHEFLTDKVLAGSVDKQRDKYHFALEDLCTKLEKSSPQTKP